MSLDIEQLEPINVSASRAKELVSHVVSNVDEWETYRIENFQDRWDEYYRMWRGIPSPKSGKKSAEEKVELAKAVMPVMQQAIETIVADEEEATFGRKQWLIFEDNDTTDLPPDVAEARAAALAITNTRFLDDADEENVEDAVSEGFLNAALYGTSVGKVVVVRRTEYVPADLEGGLIPKQVTRVALEPISPYEFVISPGAKTVDRAEGCAHVCMRELHEVWAKMDEGVYEKFEDLVPWEAGISRAAGAPGMHKQPQVGRKREVHIIEYHGLVPAHLVPGEGGKEGDTNLVEVIVTIANKERLLRAVVNPFPMVDRSFVAYQHDRIPGEFWGRGPTEKGYWAQKVLDAEVGARIAALAYSAYPMTVTDVTKLSHRGQKMGVRAGRNILAIGNPNEVMAPVRFPGPDPQTWRQSSEMERMVEMSTGSFAVATSAANERGSTATGASLSNATTIKRQKRTMRNIESNFLGAYVRKALLRLVQFDPARYPMAMVGSMKFKINATMGIIARETEQQQLTQILSTVPGGSPAYWLILQSIYSNSSLQDKEKLEGIAKMMFEQASNPPQPEPDLGGIARVESVKLAAKKHEDNLQLEYAKLEQRDDKEFKDRRLEMAKSATD